MKVTLAELLLRRKELSEAVAVKKQFRVDALFERKVVRKNVTDNVDELSITAPKLDLAQVTADYDWHARQLRLVDAAIQRTNWETQVEVNASVMDDYKKPE